jgi:hypothetical protein
MAMTPGPKEETERLIKKVVKAAGKKGGTLAELATKVGDEVGPVRRAVKYAVTRGDLKKTGSGRFTVYCIP